MDIGIKIRGTGSYVPDRVLSNSDLEKIVDTNDEWITVRTGIRERRIADPAVATSDLAQKAALAALENAGMEASELDLILISTVTPDYHLPNTASIVQRKINASRCMCFDIEAACSGLLYAIDVAHAMILGGGHRKVLVIGAEKLSTIVDYKDRSTCVLFGDGASAVILEGGEEIDGDFYLANEISADGALAEILRIPAGGSVMPLTQDVLDNRLQYLHMGGAKTFQLAVNSMTDACRKVMAKQGLTNDDIAWAIPHQANERIIAAVASRLGMGEKVYRNISRFGNTSSASIGICLDELNRSGQLKRGDIVLTAAFGAGLTWAAELYRW